MFLKPTPAEIFELSSKSPFVLDTLTSPWMPPLNDAPAELLTLIVLALFNVAPFSTFKITLFSIPSWFNIFFLSAWVLNELSSVAVTVESL